MSSLHSPSTGLGGSSEPLTPRSKIKALLATVESSDEDTSPSKKATKKTSIPTISEFSHIDLPQLPTQEDDESEEEIRPRGRLASRMQGITRPSEQPETTAAATETARDRVKKMFELQDQEREKTRNTNMSDAEDEDDDLPVAPRRLQRTLIQAPTNESSAQSTTRSPSPGLFVSSPARPSPAKSTQNASDSENDLPALKSDRFKALVERKRQERLAREAEEEARNAEKRARQEKIASELEQMASDDSGITDDEGGRKLTQTQRPSARKASKRAIEEMNRETQRMARSMQLAHQAKTRKRITKNTLFERFNFRPAGEPEPKITSSSRPTTPHSDVEMQDVQTPPSSPPLAKRPDTEAIELETEEAISPSRDEFATSASLRMDKGKGKAVEVGEEEPKPKATTKRQVRIRLPQVLANVTMLDSDDELEIRMTKKDKVKAVFDSVPSKRAQESHSLKALRALAQVRSPGKESRRRDDNHGMTAGQLQNFLQQKARQQAKVERDRRLEMLKAQGVVIQTAEERERQMQEVDDIVAKAREEAQKIMEQEREEFKKEKKENGEVDPLAWDDSEDEEYQASADEVDAEVDEAELSGSEDEDEDDEAGDNPMFEAEAEDAESEVSAEEEEDSGDKTPVASQNMDEDADDLPVLNKRRARKNLTIISDDEDDVETTPKPKTTIFKSPTVPSSQSPAVPTSVLRSAKKTFIPGLPVQGPAGLGLTQIFAGTMDDSQMGPASGPTHSIMPDFDNFPDSNFSATMDEPEDMIVDSQTEETQGVTQGVQLNFSQSQMRGLDSLLREQSSTQLSDMIELSQDGGLQKHTPLKDRFVEPPFSTVETVLVDHEQAGQGSPLVRRGRLRRKMDSRVRVEETPQPSTIEKPDTAFNLLQEGAKKEKKRQLQEEFIKKTSKAKEMVQEQAEESEDEYAGLGGADGEDSDNESVASVREMIDDAAGNDIDEAKLAAFYADRERAEDEKQVEKLFKDITTGILRRKRGADYDLSDDDDDGEARRRMKRRQFAKMQKALFSDERVKKIAENPGNQAFLRTIEDRGSDDEMDFLDIVEQPTETSQDSESQEDKADKPQTIPDSQPRKALGSAGDNRPAAHLRRTTDGKKPSNIGELRETLSDLLEEPHGSIVPATEVGSDNEDEDHPSSTRSDKENNEPNARRGRVAVVDRISLKRNSSSTSVTSNRLAFATAQSTSFKVPALLRRATTNSLVSGSSVSTTSSGVSTPASGFSDSAKIKKTASKKSGINAFTRDSERRARLEQSERRREEKKVRGAERRIGVVGGLLGRGTFE